MSDRRLDSQKVRAKACVQSNKSLVIELCPSIVTSGEGTEISCGKLV